MAVDDLDRAPEDLSVEELKDALQTGQISIQEIRENETLRQQVRHLVVKRDMEEHREIYDRLAEI